MKNKYTNVKAQMWLLMALLAAFIVVGCEKETITENVVCPDGSVVSDSSECVDPPPPPPPPVMDAVDTDGDTIPDDEDNCTTVANTNQLDDDNDAIGNACDNCPTDHNTPQIDSNNDGAGDACPPEFAITIEVSCSADASEIRIDCLADVRGRDGSQPRAVDFYSWVLRKSGELTDVTRTSQEGRISIFPPTGLACDDDNGAILGVQMTAELVSNVNHRYVSSITGDDVIVELVNGVQIPDELCP